MRILLTGVGCPGVAGTIYALKNNPANQKVYIFGVDVNNDAVGKFLCDDFQRVEFPEHSDYVHVIQRLCEVNKIDLIIPQTTRETLILSQYKNTFKRAKIPVMVPDISKVNIYNSKHGLLNLCEKLSLPCPNYHVANSKESFIALCYKLGYPTVPIVIKPCVGNGSRGVRIIIDDPPDYNKFINKKPDGMRVRLFDIIRIFQTAKPWPETLVMEYLPGQEYTVDVLNVPDARVIIPRIRNNIRSGISFITEVCNNDKIVNQINILLDNFPMFGVFGFQFKENEVGTPCLLECNPRIQGTMAAAQMAGIYNIR